MPNWCSNNMVVYGSPTEVKDFRQKCLNAIANAKVTKNWGLYEIYVQFGYEKDEILNSHKLEYNRGHIEDVSNLHYVDEKTLCFNVYYESAWSPMIDGFNYLLANHYDTLRQVTLAEEGGCDIFINTDTQHRFFDEKYYVYVEDYDTYYLTCEEEVCKVINAWNDNKPKCNSVAECQKLLKQCEGYVGSTKQYIVLEEFTDY